MPDYPVNLGKAGPSDVCCAPKPLAEPETYYPSVHLDNCELPETGTITFRYRTCRQMEDLKAETNWVDLDLLEIVSVKADKSAKSEDYGGDALDKIKAALEGGE